MNELFDTTELRQTAALARHVEIADVTGQGDLFAGASADTSAATGAVTVTAYVAITENGSNVHIPGVICRVCDTTYDPHNRHGVPCFAPYGHAEITVGNWRANGVAGADVVAVEVEVADLGDMVKAARHAAESAFTWPEPVGVLFTRQDAAGEMMLG